MPRWKALGRLIFFLSAVPQILFLATVASVRLEVGTLHPTSRLYLIGTHKANIEGIFREYQTTKVQVGIDAYGVDSV